MSEESHKLYLLIKKAINNLEITTTEYQEIMTQAHADGHVDSDEQKLLSQLHHMLADGTIKRVPG
jgi:hypothetical protein